MSKSYYVIGQQLGVGVASVETEEQQGGLGLEFEVLNVPAQTGFACVFKTSRKPK